MRAWRFSDIKIPCVRQVLVGEPIDHSLVSDMVRGYMHIHTHIYIQPRRLEKKTQKGAINHPEFSFHFPTVCRVGIARIKAQSPLLTMPYLYRNIPIPNKNLCACVRCKIEEYFITMLEYGGKKFNRWEWLYWCSKCVSCVITGQLLSPLSLCPPSVAFRHR